MQVGGAIASAKVPSVASCAGGGELEQELQLEVPGVVVPAQRPAREKKSGRVKRERLHTIRARTTRDLRDSRAASCWTFALVYHYLHFLTSTS